MTDYALESKEWWPKLKALINKHGMYGHVDPGGAELTHPQFGKCRISAFSDKDDYETIIEFLIKNGIKDAA